MTEFRFCPQCGGSLVHKEIDGIKRQACSSDSCDHVFWDNPTPVVAALVEHDGLVVLVRNKGWPDHWYGLVTGFLERDEEPEAATLREVKEELDLDGEIKLGEELVDVKPVPPERLKPWAFGTGFAVRDWLEKRQATP